MESPPSDTLLNIVSRVPTESVLECKLVCKEWQRLIHQGGSYFTDMHLSHLINNLYGSDGNGSDNIPIKVVPSLFFACESESEDFEGPTLLYHGRQINDKISTNKKYSYKENLKKINHPPIPSKLSDHLVGSCNGLICVFICHHRVIDPIYIFNPITREYVYLPELIVEADADVSYPFAREEGELNLSDISCGFGYARSTNEYKIVRIYYPYTKGHVEVYTLGSGCGWRSTGTIPSRLITHPGAGIYSNGAIYWKGEKNVVAFDLGPEEFRSLPFPPCISNCDRSVYTHGLAALGGHLFFYLEKSRMEIWSMKKRGGENSIATRKKYGIWILI